MSDHKHEAIGSKCVEIGPTACLTPTVHGDDEHLAGFFTAFDVPEGWPAGTHADGDRVIGGLNVDPHFDGERPRWTMTGSLEDGDLTLSPSVKLTMRMDGRDFEIHGYVTNGQWVPV